jgi:hypothetical protein
LVDYCIKFFDRQQYFQDIQQYTNVHKDVKFEDHWRGIPGKRINESLTPDLRLDSYKKFLLVSCDLFYYFLLTDIFALNYFIIDIKDGFNNLFIKFNWSKWTNFLILFRYIIIFKCYLFWRWSQACCNNSMNLKQYSRLYKTKSKMKLTSFIISASRFINSSSLIFPCSTNSKISWAYARN